MAKISWTKFKSFIDTRNVPISEEVQGSNYFLEAYDGPVYRQCLLTDSNDQSDYENNYQSLANSSFTDSNGMPLVRNKITRTGWHYQVHTLEISTSKIQAVYSKDNEQIDLSYTSVKFFDGAGTELTAGTQPELDSSCEKTEIYWEPTYDIEVLGGLIYQGNAPTGDIRIWVEAVPDIPASSGGSIPFVEGGLNLRHIGTGQVFEVDGITPKFMPYNVTYHTNKFKLTITHTAGTQHTIMFAIKLFREAK